MVVVDMQFVSSFIISFSSSHNRGNVRVSANKIKTNYYFRCTKKYITSCAQEKKIKFITSCVQEKQKEIRSCQ